jgi:hypothetical protein
MTIQYIVMIGESIIQLFWCPIVIITIVCMVSCWGTSPGTRTLLRINTGEQKDSLLIKSRSNTQKPESHFATDNLQPN